MEQGEQKAQPNDAQPREDGKKPLKIRIALCFDGTLNNRTNIEEREKNSDVYQQMRGSGDNSYDNGRTNVAILEPHLMESADGYDFCFKAYIEGQGTINFKKDTTRGYALGGGEAGVPERAKKGVQLAVGKILGNKKIEKKRQYIQKLTIDVFGFSRGAATARYAIHLILSGPHGNGVDNLAERVARGGCDIEPTAVEVCFAGLYDTVLSYYGSQWFSRTNNVLQQTAAARAKKALHLAAADEHRKDFPLHNIASAKASGKGEEYYLPGVHSDVGGSYNVASEELLKKTTDESKKIYMLTTNEDLVLNVDTPAAIEGDRDYLLQQGWYKSHEMTIKPVNWDDLGQVTQCALTVKRQGISTAYSNIPLKIMAEYARKPEVKLTISPKLEKRANIVLSREPDLLALEERIKNYIAGARDSKAEDWIGEGAALNDAKLKLIRNKHFHFSARPGLGYSPRFQWNKQLRQYRRTRFVYDA